MTGSDLQFRWLGVNGIELRLGKTTLLFDPFLTRPSALSVAFCRLKPDRGLLRRYIPGADAIFVSHSHYDHLMDVPAIALQTGADVYGTGNVSRACMASGIAGKQLHILNPGERIALGPFRVTALAARHKPFPGIGLLEGEWRPTGRAVDYRLDACMAYLIEVDDMRIAYCPSEAVPADVLFIGPGWKRNFYCRLLVEVNPCLVIPLHWEMFTRPLAAPLHSMPLLPGRVGVKGLRRLVGELLPEIRFWMPELMKWIVM